MTSIVLSSVWHAVMHLNVVKRSRTGLNIVNYCVLHSAKVRLYCTESNRNHCNVGTIGHVDHGKTTLTAAITKLMSKENDTKYKAYDEIDRAPEEKARGITINAAHVEYKTKNRHYAHTDCPGHADYIKNMISGTSQMDGAILVVAATDGQMPQTREHLIVAKQIGIDKVVVYINKADKVDKDVIELVEMEMREMLTDFGFDGNASPVISGSALLALRGDTSEIGEPSIRKLLDAVDSYIPTPVRDITSPFMLPVDNSFTVSGRGTVVVGTLKRGIISKNDVAELMGLGGYIKTAVSDIECFKKSVSSAKAGENIGVLLRGVKNTKVESGMILCAAGSLKLSNHFEARVYFLSRSEGGRSRPITSKYIQQLFSHTWNVACRVDLAEGMSLIMPGEHTTVTITLLKSMVMTVGQNFTIRENNITVVTGVIIKVRDKLILPEKKGLIKVTVPPLHIET